MAALLSAYSVERSEGEKGAREEEAEGLCEEGGAAEAKEVRSRPVEGEGTLKSGYEEEEEIGMSDCE